MDTRSESVRFAGGAGFELAGTLSYPKAGAPLAWVLFAHCFTCHRNYKLVANASKALAENGFGVLRFDFTGLGDSGGRFEDTNFTTNVADVLAAAEFLAAHARRAHGYGGRLHLLRHHTQAEPHAQARGESPLVLVGHSLGGSAMIRAAREIPNARAVATIASSLEPAALGRLFGGQHDAMRAEPERVFQIAVSGRPMPFRWQFIADLEHYDLMEDLKNLGLPVLIFHSPADRISDVEQAEHIFQAARHPKSFVSLGESDHLVSEREDAEMVGNVIAAWARRYVLAEPPSQ